MALYLSVSLSVLFPSQHEGNNIVIEFHFFSKQALESNGVCKVMKEQEGNS